MTVLTADLSVDGLTRLQEQILGYADRIEDACPAIAESVAQVADETARAACPVDTGSLSSSIAVHSDGDGTAQVVAASEHAAFVEFGTGIGSPSAHAKDAQAMGEGGYVVNGTGKGESGWAFPASDGTWKWTHGQSGKGFMAAGAEEARSRVTEIARRAVRG